MKVSVVSLCEKVGMSRQNFYKGKKTREEGEVNGALIEAVVRTERAVQPRLGGVKLYHMFKGELAEAGVDIGRDRFCKVLREKGLKLAPLPKAPRTTNSQHNLPVFSNQFKDLEVKKANEAWVSDITYIRTDDSFVYLSLITDSYSRKIVGYHVGDTLEAVESLKALDMAAAGLKEGEQPMHHSDRGGQYCSHKYVGKLQGLGMEISMTEENHCYENAMAERVNGILKQEYWLGGCFKNKEQAVKAVDQAIYLYNTRRPHLALNYKTPEEVHREVA